MGIFWNYTLHSLAILAFVLIDIYKTKERLELIVLSKLIQYNGIIINFE